MRATLFSIILMLLNYKVLYKSISYCLEEYIATEGGSYFSQWRWY